MPNLLIQSCSQSKNEVSEPTPAFEVYSGYFYRILKKAIRTDEFRTDTDIVILSAKHGILRTNELIETYDKRMTINRARGLNQQIVDDLAEEVENAEYDQIILNMGKDYMKSVEGLTERIDIPVSIIEGDGIGEKGRELYQFIRGDDSVPTMVNDV